jgi:hypothetical protein
VLDTPFQIELDNNLELVSGTKGAEESGAEESGAGELGGTGKAVKLSLSLRASQQTGGGIYYSYTEKRQCSY